jgi:CBS-domain-containing membrane protein
VSSAERPAGGRRPAAADAHDADAQDSGAMQNDMSSLKPISGANRALRDRLDLKGELVLALLPTLTVLGVLVLVEALTEQRLLFASLASSAFLIYLDPEHGTNAVRTLISSHMLAALLGWATFTLMGPGYPAAGTAMVAVIFLMIVLDVVHPPAVATAMGFALRSGDGSNVLLFGLAVAVTAVLVLLQRSAVWLLARARRH